MPDLRLVRAGFGLEATFGVLVNAATETAFAVTLEPERDHNRPTEWNGAVKIRGGACIPAGRYLCRRTISPRFGETFTVSGVPGRDLILFHPLNIDDQSDGCIGVGHGFDKVQVKGHATEDGIVQSAKEFAEFMALQGGVVTFWLDVIDAVPEP